MTSPVGGVDDLPYWRLNGVDIGFGLTPTLSYDTLVGGLGLGPGTYELTFDLTVPLVGQGLATTTIEIVPEPSSLGLLALAGLAVLRQRRASIGRAR